MRTTDSASRLLAAAGLAAAAVLATGASGTASAQVGTGFTYQGSLEFNGEPVDASTNFVFRLFDAETGGTQVGPSLFPSLTPDDGVFSVELDFGVDPFTANDELWLEVTANLQTLGRTKLTATPFALSTRGIEVDDTGAVSVASTNLSAGTVDGGGGIYNTAFGGQTENFLRFLAVNDAKLSAGDFLRLWSGGAERVLIRPDSTRINNDVHAFGNVGIGTDAPARRLDVRSNGLTIGGSALSADTSVVMAANDPNIDIVGLDTGSELGGISFKEVNGAGVLSDSWSWHRRTSGAGSPLRLTYGSSPNAWVNPSVMTFLPSGNVGIGTTTPDTTLDVAGRGTFDSGVTASGRSQFGFLGFGPSVATVNIVGQAADTFALAVQDPAGVIRLSVNNNGDVATQCGIICASDERLKEDITDLDTPLDKIMALRSVSFTWKDETLAKRGTQLGFVAQEVQQVLPELIGETPDGMLGVDYASLTSVLAGAVQEQQAEIETMHATIDAMQTQIESLQAGRSVAGASVAWPVLIAGGLLGGLAVARRRAAGA